MSRKIFKVPLKLGSSWTEWLPPDASILGCAMVEGEGPFAYYSSTQVDFCLDWMAWEFSLVSVGGLVPDGAEGFRVGGFKTGPAHHPWFMYARPMEVDDGP